MSDLDLQRLRDLSRSESLLPLDRQLLRDVANALERVENPVPLNSRSEYRAAVESEDGFVHRGPVARDRRAAKAWRPLVEGRRWLEHRTVVESDWRPTHG